MSRWSGRSVRRVLLVAASAGSLVLLAGCGKTLGTLVTEAMDGCITQRNSAFIAGRGATALDTPLPDSLATSAKRLAYQRALTNYERIAETAANQVTLVCALELASYYRNGDVGVLLWKYTKHPDAAVAASARKLLTSTQDPLPGTFQ